jgi:hypothetical protein
MQGFARPPRIICREGPVEWILLMPFVMVLAGLGLSLSFQARRLERLLWSTAVLNRRVGLLMSHFKIEDGLPNWQKLALDPSSSKIAAVKAHMAETGSGLREALEAFESWRGQR